MHDLGRMAGLDWKIIIEIDVGSEGGGMRMGFSAEKARALKEIGVLFFGKKKKKCFQTFSMCRMVRVVGMFNFSIYSYTIFVCQASIKSVIDSPMCKVT